ncbi:MAG: 7TM diverse intracellular signaling domain-containing protein, partial [Pricia sp.]
YIHVKSDGEVGMLPLNLVPEKIFLYETYREQLFYGFFYGILILACIIYLFFYSAMRDTAFVYYGLYVLFIATLQFSLDGLFHQYVMPDGGYFSRRAVLFAALTSLYFFVNYGRTFLDVRNHSKSLWFCFKVLSVMLIAAVVGLMAIPGFLVVCYPMANMIGLVVLSLMITTMVYLRIKKVAVDRFFVMGISFLVLGFVVFILNNLNIVANSFITENGAKFGIGLEIIFLSLSMGNRIRNLRESNEKNQLLALQRLEDMNDMKSSFISNISHELRTPLNMIMGVADTLRMDKRDKDLQDKCKLILTSSETLLGHVDDILDFTSIEKGEQELHEVSFDLHVLLNRVVNLNRKKAHQKNLDFNYTFQDGLPQKITGDKRKVMQVLNNLLDNAVKFTTDGEVAFHVGFSTEKDGKVAFTFRISDTGIGISKEKMITIYESFTKKSCADKREFYGLGLGLYVAKSYVDLQKGSIEIKNRPQRGTECLVALDFVLNQELSPDPDEIRPVNNGNFDLEGCRILLVEDNKMNQMVIKMAVKKWGNVNLDIANHGGEALDMLIMSNYDLILMDLQMPVMDGFEATANIRAGKAGESFMNIPILVVTADATDATKKEIFRLGANDYMTKPIKGDVLYDKIKKNLMTVAK